MICKERQTQSIYIHPLCSLATGSEMPPCKLSSFVFPGVSSTWEIFQKQDHIDLYALSSGIRIVAAAWVSNGCQMGVKMYQREVEYTQAQLCLLYNLICCPSCLLGSEGGSNDNHDLLNAPSA